MKKWILKALAGILVLYAAAGFFGVPYVIKNIVPEKVFDATQGGIFSVQKASFNPFTFRLKIQNLAFKTPKNSDFVHVKTFVINVNPVDYAWKQGWVVSDIRIENPVVTIHKDAQGEMNFGWLSKLGEDTNDSNESSQPLALLIHQFTLRGGMVHYIDQSDGKNYRQSIDSIGFHLENIDLRDASNSKGVMRVYASINEGGFVDLRGKIAGLKPFALNGSVAFDSGKLYTPWRYLKEKLPIEVADGTASFGFNYALSTEDINATVLSNVHMELNRLRILRKAEQTKLLNLQSVTIADGTVWPMRKVFESPRVKL
ncbi:MAG TPA: DUF748 domain-containing protein, partial [Sulfuricurvum sp.]|nr:DUF748 domain-containing protein [Sulfuricurvum sp.]